MESEEPVVNLADKHIWIDKGIALAVIRRYFREGHSLIRIAAGFFTVRGYNLIRGAAHGKELRILVGIQEPGEQRARKVLVDQIMHDLRAGRDEDRHQAVVDLASKLRVGQVRIVDARALNHHAKVYIVDDWVAIVASSNVSQRGFIEAIESGTVNTNRENVLEAIAAYDNHFEQAHDLTAELFARLEDWLRFRKPWEVYLKTLDVLNVLDDLPDTKESYRTPVSFQLSIVAMALRQIYTYGGAMVVASTGLGKTIIATDVARRLHRAGEISNVLVVAPAPVHEEWKRRMRSAGIMPEVMTPDIWDRQEAPQVEGLLSDLDKGWFIIIDESHEFRNRFKKSEFKRGKKNTREDERLAFRRLVPAVNRLQCKILLLTATPYSTTVDNINHQLHLLPHTSIHQKGQLSLIGDDFIGDKAWRVDKPEELRDLEVACVVTTPAVAKYWAYQDSGSAYINFGNERQYIPKVTLYRSNIAPVLQHEVAELLAMGCFKTKSWRPSRRTFIEKTVRVAWGSSPRALREVLEKTISPDGYEANFKKTSFQMDIATRQEHIQPVITKLEQFGFDDDLKLRQFFAVLDPILAERGKVVVFSEQRSTVVYLEEAIKALRPMWLYGSTIAAGPDGGYRSKTRREIERMVAHFSPIANKYTVSDDPIDIFLSTDAYGVGINLQDAQVVINYDLAWTPIEPAQRAGRILRLWQEPRTIQLFAFVPSVDLEIGNLLAGEDFRPVELVARRWATLITRHTWSSQILELPVLTIHDQQDVDPLHLPTVRIDSSMVDLQEMTDASDDGDEMETSPILTRHVSRYDAYKQEARRIPSDIVSAKVHRGSTPLVYVLLRYNDQIFWAVYDLEKKKLLRRSEYQLLNLIESNPEDLPAFVDRPRVELAADECIEAWHRRNPEIPLEEVFRECALYLVPSSTQSSLASLLEGESVDKPYGS